MKCIILQHVCTRKIWKIGLGKSQPSGISNQNGIETGN